MELLTDAHAGFPRQIWARWITGSQLALGFTNRHGRLKICVLRLTIGISAKSNAFIEIYSFYCLYDTWTKDRTDKKRSYPN